LRHGELHVVYTEVREELRGVVILMTIPAAVPPDANLGEPLPAQHEVAFPSRARLRFRKLRLKRDLELNVRPGRDGLRNFEVDYSLVVFVAVVGRDELQLRSQIALTHDFKALDVLRAVILVFPFLIASIAAAHQFGIAHKCGLRLKCVLIKMEREVVKRLSGEVVVGQDLGRVHRVLDRVILGFDRVVHDAL
jgi:hypothetical protein